MQLATCSAQHATYDVERAVNTVQCNVSARTSDCGAQARALLGVLVALSSLLYFADYAMRREKHERHAHEHQPVRETQPQPTVHGMG